MAFQLVYVMHMDNKKKLALNFDKCEDIFVENFYHLDSDKIEE